MNQKLRNYQKEAVNAIYNLYQSSCYKGKMFLSVGLGKSVIIATTVKMILENYPSSSVLFLSSKRMICEQMLHIFGEYNLRAEIYSSSKEWNHQNILIATYQALFNSKSIDLSSYDLIICDEAQFLKNEKYIALLEDSQTKYLGIIQENILSEGWFHDAKCIYKYTQRDAINDGYINLMNENSIVKDLLFPLLSSLGFKNIENEVPAKLENGKTINFDILAKKQNDLFVFEVKIYRASNNLLSIINNALKQVIYYKQNFMPDKKVTYIIIMLSKIDQDIKQNLFQRHNIEIWDISNLIYLCKDNRELSDLLISYTPYSIIGIEEKPINMEVESNSISLEKGNSIYPMSKHFQQRIDSCKTGRVDGNDKIYEKICTDIIRYLFEVEFSQISEQHRTDDEMFRMDLLCSLKGTTEFWKFLIRFYSTKFVVFEYKNYADYISQNLIYITEKYLFPVALRNVAFIISRLGFDPNAEKAALGCLKEHGKLIISLNDEELIKMIAIKENGEEPSDYLLDKIEQILMSVSK